MGKTIAELIAEGKSVEEISKMAQAEADAVAAAKDKRKIDPEEVNAVREYLIADVLDYVEAITGIDISDEDADEITKVLTDKMKVIELFIQAAVADATESKPKPKVKKESESDSMADLFNLFRLFQSKIISPCTCNVYRDFLRGFSSRDLFNEE